MFNIVLCEYLKKTMNETQRKKRVVITMDICRNIRRHIEMNRSLKEISCITELSYNSVSCIANKIGQGLLDNNIAKTRKGRKVHEEAEIKSRLESITQIYKINFLKVP